MYENSWPNFNRAVSLKISQNQNFVQKILNIDINQIAENGTDEAENGNDFCFVKYWQEENKEKHSQDNKPLKVIFYKSVK